MLSLVKGIENGVGVGEVYSGGGSGAGVDDLGDVEDRFDLVGVIARLAKLIGIEIGEPLIALGVLPGHIGVVIPLLLDSALLEGFQRGGGHGGVGVDDGLAYFRGDYFVDLKRGDHGEHPGGFPIEYGHWGGEASHGELPMAGLLRVELHSHELLGAKFAGFSVLGSRDFEYDEGRLFSRPASIERIRGDDSVDLHGGAAGRLIGSADLRPEIRHGGGGIGEWRFEMFGVKMLGQPVRLRSGNIHLNDAAERDVCVIGAVHADRAEYRWGVDFPSFGHADASCAVGKVVSREVEAGVGRRGVSGSIGARQHGGELAPGAGGSVGPAKDDDDVGALFGQLAGDQAFDGGSAIGGGEGGAAGATIVIVDVSRAGNRTLIEEWGEIAKGELKRAFYIGYRGFVATENLAVFIGIQQGIADGKRGRGLRVGGIGHLIGGTALREVCGGNVCGRGKDGSGEHGYEGEVTQSFGAGFHEGWLLKPVGGAGGIYCGAGLENRNYLKDEKRVRWRRFNSYSPQPTTEFGPRWHH